MNNKDLLYKKLNALRLVVDSSIVDDIKSTVDALFREQNLKQTDSLKDVSPNDSKPLVSRSLLSDEVIELQAKEMTTFPKMCYPTGMMGIQCGAKYNEGAKWARDILIAEIERRQQMIISEPDGLVRETMINDLLVGLQ